MTEETLKSVFGASNHSTTQASLLNKNSIEFKPLFASGRPIQSSALPAEDEYLSTVGSALDDLLLEIKSKYPDPPSESPQLSTAHTSPQMMAAFLPPPPGYDPIVESNVCVDDAGYDPSIYSSPAWRPYPPPFHLGHKLFVGALPYSVSEGDLFPLFSQFGEILELHIQRDWLGRSKGCAWLRYASIEECDAAIESLHNNYYLGSMNRPLQLTYASDKPIRPRTASMNEEVVIQQPSVPPRSRAMTDNTVPTPSSSVLGKLRQMMSSSVDMDPPEPLSGRSPLRTDTVGTSLEVRGIPVDYSDEQIRNVFSQFGPLDRMERSETDAIVDFRFPADAERARSVVDGAFLSGSCETPLTVRSAV
jgi:hypothetical protein